MAIGTTTALLLGLGAGGLGGALSGRKAARTGTQSGTSTTTQTPTISPEMAPLQKMLIDLAQQRLGQKVPLEGYEAGGIGNINTAYDIMQQNLQNKLSSRGLAGSNLSANAGLQSELSRAGDIAKFQQGLPLLERELQQQDWGNAMGLYAATPWGGTTTNQYTGEYVVPGSAAGSAFSGMGSMLGWLLGQGIFDKKKGFSI